MFYQILVFSQERICDLILVRPSHESGELLSNDRLASSVASHGLVRLILALLKEREVSAAGAGNSEGKNGGRGVSGCTGHLRPDRCAGVKIRGLTSKNRRSHHKYKSPKQFVNRIIGH